MTEKFIFVFLITSALSVQAFAGRQSCENLFIQGRDKIAAEVTDHAHANYRAAIQEARRAYNEIGNERYFRHVVAELPKLYSRREDGESAAEIVEILRDIHAGLRERLDILWKRPLSPRFQVVLDEHLKQIAKIKDSKRGWAKIAVNDVNLANARIPSPPERASHEEMAEYNRVIGRWRMADRLIQSWALKGQPLNLERLRQLDEMAREAGVDQWPGYFLPGTHFNYFDRIGSPRDHRDIFVGHTIKFPRLEQLLAWIEANIERAHPVILAAKAREMYVSIHPRWDGNGRTARWIQDYILIRRGFPPPLINHGVSPRESFVGLMTLREFDDQVRPEQSVALVVDGLLRSYRLLGVDVSETNLASFRNRW